MSLMALQPSAMMAAFEARAEEENLGQRNWAFLLSSARDQVSGKVPPRNQRLTNGRLCTSYIVQRVKAGRASSTT